MKKKTKRLLGILLAAALLGGVLGFTALAGDDEPTVIFDASKNQFTIKGIPIVKTTDGKAQTAYPDLFPNLKDMMPGDTQETQKINVSVINASGKTVKLYLRADNFTVVEVDKTVVYNQPDVEDELPVYEEDGKTLSYDNPADPTNSDYDKLFTKSDEVLYPATLTVSVTDKKGKELFSSKSGTLDDGVVELGTFSSTEDDKTITVTFALPIEAGNEVAGLTAKLGWVFTAEVTSNGGGGGPITPVDPPDLNKEDHFAYIVGYPDGNVKPQGNITRAEVATIFFRMLTDESRAEIWSQTNSYSDVTLDKWFNNAISTLSNGGIINGYEDGTFQPNKKITRAEFATMAVRFFSASYDGEDLFPDIDKHWAQEYINTAASQGIINGYEDGTFRPDQPITRAEAMTIVNRVLERHPDKDHLLDTMIQWPDNMDTAKWYYADVQEATNSHDYDVKTNTDGEKYEVWTKLLPVRDWAALEKEWSDANSSENPGDVVK